LFVFFYKKNKQNIYIEKTRETKKQKKTRNYRKKIVYKKKVQTKRQPGQKTHLITRYADLTRREFFLLLPFLLLTFITGFGSNLVFDPLRFSVASLLYSKFPHRSI